MGNDHSRFNSIKKPHQPIVIELWDNKKVTVSKLGLITVPQEYEVNSPDMPMFWLSLLSINQLDTAEYTSRFGCGKCFRSSATITITSNRVSDLGIISPETGLTSTSMSTKSTTGSWMKKGEVASSSTHTTVPQCPPTTGYPNPTQKPITISESRLWKRYLAHIHPTARRSPINGYTKDNSVCTAFIQAKHEEMTIKAKTKHTTNPSELIRRDMCGQFSMPTPAGHRYYTLFIIDYTCYTSIWVLPDRKSKTCTSAYQPFQARIDSMGYKVNRFWCDNGGVESDNETFRLVHTACGTSSKRCPRNIHHKDGVAECMILNITANAQSMMIDSQAPLVFRWEEVNTMVYLHNSVGNGSIFGTGRFYRSAWQRPYHIKNWWFLSELPN